MSINQVSLTGNLTRDPELRATKGGLKVLDFHIAVNDRKRNAKSGEWEDYANFFEVAMFGNRAEALAPMLRKGMKVSVGGKLRYSSWESSDGARRSKVTVIADDLEMLGRGPEAAAEPAAAGDAPELFDEDVAF